MVRERRQLLMVGQRNVRFRKALGYLLLQGMPSKKVDAKTSFDGRARHVGKVHVSSTDLVGVNAVCDKMYDCLSFQHTVFEFLLNFAGPKVWQFGEFRKFIVALPPVRVTAYAPARLYAEHFE
jgi:hypothetical protein